MIGLVIAATIEAVLILALIGRVYAIETKLDEVINAINNHAVIIDEQSENISRCFVNDETFSNELSDVEGKIRWMDEIDKL